MTKAMRWGASALFILGGVAMGAFVGCGSEEETPVTPPEDTGPGDTQAETTPTDTPEETTTDAVTDGGGDADADAGPPPADRGASLLFASPDLGGMFACFGAFSGDPSAAGSKPVQALGPIGVPDSADPSNPAKFKALPYGAVVPLPLNATAAAALEAFHTAVYLVKDNPAAATPAKTCADVWETAKADPKMWKAFAPKSIKRDDHGLVVMRGCVNPASASTLECGTPPDPANFEIKLELLDTAKPTTFAGGGSGAKVGFQFLHLSNYKGAGVGTPPSLQNVDVYFIPQVASGGGDAGADGGDGGDGGGTLTPDPTGAVKIATNVKYGDVVKAVVGVQLKGNPEDAFIAFAPTGVAPDCAFSAATPTCTKTWIPLKAFLAAYKPTGGGFVDGANQFVGIAGAIIPKTPGDATTVTARVPFGNIRLKP